MILAEYSDVDFVRRILPLQVSFCSYAFKAAYLHLLVNKSDLDVQLISRFTSFG